MRLANKHYFVLALLLGTAAAWAVAAEAPPVLLIHNAQFEPRTLEITAATRTKIVIRNLDGIPAEFESYDLSREVVVPAHGEVSLFVGPADPGRYEFFNDFNRDMKGTLVVKPAAGGY